MDFTFTEEQETVAKVARDLFDHRTSPEHLTELETGDIRYDDALWKELAAVDLLGIALPESWNSECCWPRSAGAWLRCRSTRRCCSAPTRLPGTAIPNNSNASCPA